MPTLFSICAQQRRRGGAFDADAADYFARAEALGGSFDQTAINATYTEAYVKGAISDCIAALKTDAVWDKITELYLLAGVSFPGLMAKVKHAGTAVTTNVGPFVAGDYLAAGTGAGLQGDGTKSLPTGVSADAIPDDAGIGAYLTHVAVSGGINGIIGAVNYQLLHDAGSVSRSGFYRHKSSSAPNFLFAGFNDGGPITISRSVPSTSQVDITLREVVFINTIEIDNTQSGEIILGARSTGFQPTLNRLSAGWQIIGMDASDLIQFHARINGLMTALGCNVYNNP